MRKLHFLIFTLGIFSFLFLNNSCQPKKTKVEKEVVNSLERIRETGKLKVVCDFNSTNYFIYRGQPMGYQFELLTDLADHLGAKLEVEVQNDLNESFELVKSGESDILGINLTVTRERSKVFDFTIPHTQTRQVLVQRKKHKDYDDNTEYIQKAIDLGGKVVYVMVNSSYSQRLNNLAEEIGDSIHIIEKGRLEEEELISMVANEEIDYTVVDENVAMVNRSYYNNIDISVPVSFHQNIAWAVKKGDDSLRIVINEWLDNYKNSIQYTHIYNKYFKNRRRNIIAKSDYYAITSGQISKYDDLIKKYSKKIDWDWRLLASLIYQESRFLPHVKSWAGAYGLMQLMPSTAQRFGVDYNSPPEKHIKAGVDFIKWLDRRFLARGINDKEERIKFILASYNVGLGHILDARVLAKKEGNDPDVWEQSVDTFILKKSQPEYYKDPDVRFGYCRGIETYNYVTEIMERYEHYKNIIAE